MKLRNRSSLLAFTLLEIMLVVAIITLLLGTGVFMMRGQMDTARKVRIQADFQAIKTQLDLYENMNGFLPTSEQGLDALVNMPQSEPKPTRWTQLFQSVLKDPYDSEYVYVYPGKHNPKGYDLISKGRDRTLGTEDDIGNWEFSK